PEILISNYIEKWDGKLPTVVSGDSGTMMIDLSKLLESMGNTKSGTATTPSYQPPAANDATDTEE
ncbi:MAG: hypothetical protein K2G87_03035, partial [Oscillospiraceae bacterium]|nr:hypothetical protein [Oscillospiraceae bacterium]